MNNLDWYESLRAVPDTAKKTIQAGKLKGFTDINPMWRIKALTEAFGPCGIGWKAPVKKQWLETYEGTVCAFCNIELYVKCDGVWSDPIDGTGGSKLVQQTRNGADVSDECFKMAYTDAISVAAKMLGVGADVYWSDDSAKEDKTKYGGGEERAGTDKLTTNDCKRLANKLIEVYGKDEAVRNLIRLTGHKSTEYVSYDEYTFALEKIEKERALQTEKSDFIGDVEINAIKESIKKHCGGYSEANLIALTGIKESELVDMTVNEFGVFARKLNEAVSRK